VRDSPVSLDFETRSPTPIRLGVERYSRDPGCDVLTLSFRLPSGKLTRTNRGPNLAGPWINLGDRDELLDYVAAGGLVRGWNVMFEWHIWNNVCAPKYGWPELKLEQCVDTMAWAAAMNLPQALGRCAEVLHLPADQQKDKRGKYLIQRLCVPHKPTKARDGIWVEDSALFDEMCGYCDQDVVTEESIGKKLRPLSEFEQQIWVATQRVNLRGVPVALEECAAVEEVVEKEKERLNKELAAITSGRVKKASNRNDLITWVNEQGLEAPVDFEDPEDEDDGAPVLANMKAKTVEVVLKRDDLPPQVRRALEIRAAVVQTSTAKFSKMRKIAADDGTLKNLFVYHGAGPGRWASRGGLNIQNFARPVLSKKDIPTAINMLSAGAHGTAVLFFGDQVMDAAVSCLRGVLKAPDGFDFIDADFSSVENRVAAWTSGQVDKLELFAKGLDEYKTFGSEWLYRCQYDEITPEQRQFTKPVVLGGVFGLGARGLVMYAEQYGVKMSLLEAKRAVRAFRRAYRRVRDTWYECSDAMIAATENPGVWFEAGAKFRFFVHRDVLWMQLPSGRVIAWLRPRLDQEIMVYEQDTWEGDVIVGTEVIRKLVPVVTVESVDTKTRQWCRHPLIGSSAFQSGVQGTARDLLACGLLNVEAAGYPVVLMAHDELMACVRKGWGDPEEFGRLMCKPEPWFHDLPLAFEAWRDNRFRK
jgi:DNA polymerase